MAPGPVQSAECWGSTRSTAGVPLAFLGRMGLAPGLSVLDVGCRDGQVTMAMARATGPGGCVLGIDADGEALLVGSEGEPEPD